MARAARRAEPELTEEQLRLGLRQLWRPGWPNELAAVLAHPVRGPAVRGMARQLSRQLANAGRRAAPVRATPPVPPTPLHYRRPRWTFDAKRAAANDLGDD